ncbi:MAG: DUF3570 domain-containing protein [Polyangiales bacterium]
MQLRFSLALALAACLAALGRSVAAAQAETAPRAEITAGSSIFHESGGPLHMTVITPEVAADVAVTNGVSVNAGWTADIVSGASVAVVDAPAGSVDAISGASVHDVRHVLGGGVKVQDGQSSLAGGYHYGTENDYRSNSFDVGARTELFERNTALELTYARAFDRVCDGPNAAEAVLKTRLDNSDGCFNSARTDRHSRALGMQTFQGAWTQQWTPVLSVQTVATAQMLHGFQANPYRAVRIGRTAAQEHHPNERARYSVGVGLRIWIEPLSGALQPQLRVYRDTWDIQSASGELGYEQTLGHGLRFRARARYYLQSGAAFYSDDYVLAPKGQYFTGDRELSPMRSALLGGRFTWSVPENAEGEVLGLLSGLDIVLGADLLKSWFDHFHYDRAKVPNTMALFGSLSVLAAF